MKASTHLRCNCFVPFLLLMIFILHPFLISGSPVNCQSPLIRVMVFKIAAAVQEIYLDKEKAGIKQPSYKSSCFLPPAACFRQKNVSSRKALELFYSAVILSDEDLIEKTFEYLAHYLENPKDKVFYSGLYRLTIMALKKDKTNFQEVVFDAEAAAYHFLLTGNFETGIKIKRAQERKLKKVMADFKKNIYHTKVIETNRDTLRDKIFLWLGARYALACGDYHLADACLRSTFAYDLLDRFNLDNQIYFYATLQLALKIGGSFHLGYVYTGLKHLTCHLEQVEIGELIDNINRIRYR